MGNKLQKMRNVKILGYGTYLPEGKITFGDQTRYRCGTETQIDMAVEAGNRALEKAGLTINDIDLIISANAVCVQLIPCTAALIHERMTADLNLPAFDVNSSCTSFITAFEIAANYIELGQYRNILIISAERASTGLNPDQKESYELFSDGAAAVVLTEAEREDQGVIAAVQKTFSAGAHATEIRAGGTRMPGYDYTPDKKAEYLFDMKGKQILVTTLKCLPPVFERFFEETGIGIDDIDLVIPHQASRALSLMMERLQIPKEKYINWVSDYGNMVSASVPYVLCKVLEQGSVKEGDLVMLCGTAAGLTINALMLRL